MNNRRFALFIFLIIVFIGLLVINDIRWNINENDITHLTLITQAKYGEEWERLIAGAKQAANEFGVEVKLLAPDDARTYREQAQLLETIQAQTTDGIILSPIAPYEQSGAIINMSEAGIPILTTVTSLDHINVIHHVGTDQYDIGQALAELVISDYGSKISISVISVDTDEPGIIMREKGMREYFGNIPSVVVKETISSNDDVYYATKLAESSINTDQPDVIIGLNLRTTIGSAQAVEALGSDVAVYGIDISNDIIDYMDKNIINGVVAQNYFSMGYLAVKELVEHIEDYALLNSQAVTPYVVTKENMYSKESQMILFPIK